MEVVKKALVIVAHPDDETIWTGGMILRNLDWDWTILSLCRKDDIDRALKFVKVCKEYKALGIISDLDDENDEPLETEDVVDLISGLLNEREYDYIFTHGENAEYGHVRHSDVHKAVRRMIEKEFLRCKKLYFFDYIPGDEIAPHDSSLRIPIANPDADFVLDLSDVEYTNKYKLIHKVYGFEDGIFETLACKNKEGFKVLNFESS